MRNATVVAALFALVVFGCDGTAVNPDDQAQDQVEVDGKADGSSAAVARPLGTYRVAHQYAGRLTMVTFKSDKTFHYEMMVYCAGGGTCPPVGHDGTYTFSKSGTTRYIRFLDADGQLIDRYAYQLTGQLGDTLKLRLSGDSEWTTLPQSGDAYCAAAADCGLQGLIHPMCAPGGWTCEDNLCAFQCGQVEQTACETAGGACVPLVPDACEHGTVGDARYFGCGGGVGVQCCLPMTVNPCQAAGGSCVALTPTSCANGTVGDASQFSCGTGLGVECCLPQQNVDCTTDAQCGANQKCQTLCGNGWCKGTCIAK